MGARKRNRTQKVNAVAREWGVKIEEVKRLTPPRSERGLTAYAYRVGRATKARKPMAAELARTLGMPTATLVKRQRPESVVGGFQMRRDTAPKPVTMRQQDRNRIAVLHAKKPTVGPTRFLKVIPKTADVMKAWVQLAAERATAREAKLAAKRAKRLELRGAAA